MTTEPSTIEPAPLSARPPPTLFRRLMAVIGSIWFFGFPVYFAAIVSLIDDPPVWLFIPTLAGGLGWLASGYWIYHKLFDMAEARWPATKGIREIVSPILRGLLFPHHHK
jgi:hypothetical protein